MAEFTIDSTSFNKAARYPLRYGYQARGTRPTSIVVHSTEGVRGQTLGSAARYLFASNMVSAHYLIGREGIIIQMLDPIKYQAWHAGDALTSWDNAKSIGIELLHARGEDWPAVQKDALAWLLRRLTTDYRIALHAINTHGQVAIPGPYKRKKDPTDWPHSEFIAWRDRLGPPPLINPLDPQPYKVRGLPIYQRQDMTGPVVDVLPTGAQLEIDKTYANGAGHDARGRGFLDMDGLEAL